MPRSSVESPFIVTSASIKLVRVLSRALDAVSTLPRACFLSMGCRSEGKVVATSGADGGGVMVRGGAMELIDRDAERDSLDRLVAAVLAGESRALVVSGEAGV